MNERIREIRQNFKMSRTDFGNALGVSGDVINNLERGRIEIKNERIKLICSTFGINETWLRTGEGEMFKMQLPHDEVTEYVANLLEYDGKGNPFYDIIIDMMKAYSEMDDLSQMVIREWFSKIKEYKKPTHTSIPKETTSISQNKETDIEKRMEIYREYLEEKERATEKLSS